MPSISAHLSDSAYQYILETTGEDDTKSSRIADLVEKGIEVEQDEE